MANILLLTNIYTLPDVKLFGSTDVCRYFVKEWAKVGHNVKVVYNYSIFTPVLHNIANKFSQIICDIFPTVINSQRFDTSFEYSIDGIDVLLNPIYRFAPKIPFKESVIEKNVHITINWLNRKNFHPDIIVGHFLLPNIQIIPILGDYYRCKTAIIAHGKYNAKRDKKLLKINKNKIDLWGFRSFPIKKSFNPIIDDSIDERRQFMCLSGIPSDFIVKDSYKKHSSNIKHSVIYVGNLIKRKFPISVLKAFYSTYANKNDSCLKFIGSGNQLAELEQYKINHNLNEKVLLLGRLKRDKVREELLKSEIFVMISENETFGLVYLEAMACGCIVIASRDEGMDGIICHGHNGFLCAAGDENELSEILMSISKLNSIERMRISKNAIETAIKMTDEKMSIEYLNAIIGR